ncbi:hypothetical protein ISN44_As09g027580 [Arabidopsis suecica]|uniref:Uncharacterized protein n=1 Tax=Arabidopsis suecica TaxID=45249 RepID=A0A8T2ANR4_ARASU|nr:hypothetical protein ISN44_As09g027580 [Arabidopsis suecica]
MDLYRRRIRLLKWWMFRWLMATPEHLKELRFCLLRVLEPGDIAGLISGVDCSARTCLPLRGRAVVNFRWGIRVPTEIKHDFNPTAVISLRGLPFLVMNKIGIVHVDGSNVEQTKSVNKPGQVSGSGMLGSADVAEACLAVRRQMEELRTENSQLKRSVEDLRQEITNVRPFSPAPMDFGSSSR